MVALPETLFVLDQVILLEHERQSVPLGYIRGADDGQG
jgi:hypothetical protein